MTDGRLCVPGRQGETFLLGRSANTTLAPTSEFHLNRGSPVIPEFDIHGVLPPIRPGVPAHSADRSPYPSDILTLARRFATSQERRAILTGLLDLREMLRDCGLGVGFQWVNGSFTEDVEVLRGRPPGDIDVVTFAALGDGASQAARAASMPELFDRRRVKADLRVDHFFVNTGAGLDSRTAHRVSYWSSMWSHQRDTNRWKGFVSVPLVSNDVEARNWLAAQNWSAGGAP